MKAKKTVKLDKEEREILRGLEKGEWKPVENEEAEIRRLRAAVRATLRKDKRINIRLSTIDLEGLRRRAFEEGIPYQTLISSVLHKYASGRLTEKRS
ncbi:MAG: antitoxin [Deltaproteobacteria bacterium]|nr:antitoxin [Deltaproteobacteria bacterium]